MVQFLASNLMLGLMVFAVLLGLGRWQHTALRDIVSAPARTWRVLAWVAIGLTLALVAWFSLADDWRKVFGELLDVREQYLSERAVLNPVDPGIRRVSLLLLAATLLCSGALFARYVGGYGLQFVLLILGLSAFFPLYLIRQRLDTGLAGIADLPSLASLAMLATLLYLLLDYACNIALIVVSYLGLLGLAALPVTLALDLLGRRNPPVRPTTQANAFYATIHSQLEERRAATPAHLPGEEGTPPR